MTPTEKIDAALDSVFKAGDMRAAQMQLGHSNMAMTEKYVRGRRGDKTTPTK